LNDSAAVPVLVHSVSRDLVEMLNSLLRNAGLAAHCTWIPSVHDIADALEQLNPELLVAIEPSAKDLKDMAAVRDHFASSVPLIVAREQLSATAAGEDMANGARDTVAIGRVAHLAAVIRREFARLPHGAHPHHHAALRTGLSPETRDRAAPLERRDRAGAGRDCRAGQQFLAGTVWLRRPQRPGGPARHGPVHARDPGRAQGRPRGLPAGPMERPSAQGGRTARDGSIVPLELVLDASEYEGEPCVQLIVPVYKRDERQLASDLADAVRHDATTGLWLRRHLLQLCAERLAKPPAGGLRCFALVRIDKFEALARDIGVTAAEELLTLFPAHVRTMLGPNDLAGHFGAASLLLLLERGNARDAEAWSESLVERVGKHAFRIGERQFKITCSVGLALVANTDPNLDAAIADAQESVRRGAEREGNRVVAKERVDQDARRAGL